MTIDTSRVMVGDAVLVISGLMAGAVGIVGALPVPGLIGSWPIVCFPRHPINSGNINHRPAADFRYPVAWFRMIHMTGTKCLLL